jgi:hypothetical protein
MTRPSSTLPLMVASRWAEPSVKTLSVSSDSWARLVTLAA